MKIFVEGMLPRDLIAFIFDAESSPLREVILAWVDGSQAFADFVYAHGMKIRAKLRRCRSLEELKDLFWELEVAHLLLKSPHFRLEYEASGAEQARAPDYRVVNAAGGSFDVEAARIRAGRAETIFATWKDELIAAIRAVPSRVGVTLDVGSWRFGAPLVEQIEDRLLSIKAGLRDCIVQADGELDVGESRHYEIPGAEGLVEAIIVKPVSKARQGPTSYHGSSSPIWYTQKEFRKFGDIVCAKLNQLRAGTAGVLVIGSRNATHDKEDCEQAISELSRRARRHDNVFFQRKGFADSTDFSSQSRRLSAIVFRGSWIGNGPRNFVWINGDATMALDKAVVEYLTTMD